MTPMTAIATHPADLAAQPLPVEVAERLARLRPYAVGADPGRARALVEQAFRNFPATVPTAVLVAHLTPTL